MVMKLAFMTKELQQAPTIEKLTMRDLLIQARVLTKDNEFIHILGNYEKENILDRIQKANYFTIILDSTLNISHTNQMSFICQYIVVEDKEVEVWESLLGFITEHRKIAYNIKKMILDRLEKEKLDFNNVEE